MQKKKQNWLREWIKIMFHLRYGHALLNMYMRGLNKFTCNPLTSCKRLDRQCMNIVNDYCGRVSRNSRYRMVV